MFLHRGAYLQVMTVPCRWQTFAYIAGKYTALVVSHTEGYPATNHSALERMLKLGFIEHAVEIETGCCGKVFNILFIRRLLKRRRNKGAVLLLKLLNILKVIFTCFDRCIYECRQKSAGIVAF